MELGIPAELTWWSLANSQFVATVVTAGVSIFAAVIARQIVTRVENATDQQKKNAVDEQLAKREEPLSDFPTEEEIKAVENQASGDKTPFAKASRSFKDIRSAVDELTKRIADGRRRRKYKSLSKTDLRQHVYFLWQDDMITLPVAKLVDEAITKFYSYRTRPGEISEDTLELIERAASQMRSLAA